MVHWKIVNTKEGSNRMEEKNYITHTVNKTLVDINPLWLVIAANINGLNTSNKKQSGFLKNLGPNIW